MKSDVKHTRFISPSSSFPQICRQLCYVSWRTLPLAFTLVISGIQGQCPMVSSTTHRIHAQCWRGRCRLVRNAIVIDQVSTHITRLYKYYHTILNTIIYTKYFLCFKWQFLIMPCYSCYNICFLHCTKVSKNIIFSIKPDYIKHR